MVADLFYGGPEKDTLDKVEVLCHHGHHIYIAAIGKALYRLLQARAPQEMETMVYFPEIIVQELLVLNLFL